MNWARPLPQVARPSRYGCLCYSSPGTIIRHAQSHKPLPYQGAKHGRGEACGFSLIDLKKQTVLRTEPSFLKRLPSASFLLAEITYEITWGMTDVPGSISGLLCLDRMKHKVTKIGTNGQSHLDRLFYRLFQVLILYSCSTHFVLMRHFGLDILP